MTKRPLIALFALILAMIACSSGTTVEDAPEATQEAGEPQQEAATSTPESQQERSETAVPVATEERSQPSEPEDTGILPASLYFINADDEQVYRLDRDGVTLTQVTYEPSPVTALAVSAEAQRVAYVSNNSLYLVDLYGAGRMVVAAGDVNVEQFDLYEVISSPTWKPDGTQLAYNDAGLAIYDLASGTSTTLLESDPPPTYDEEGVPNQTGGDPNNPPVAVSPIAWSPDGTKMLIQQAIYNSDGLGVAVYDMATGSITLLSSPDGLVCCNPTWTPDSSAIIISSDTAGMISPGMWRIDATTGDGERLVQGNPGEGNQTYTLIFGAQQLADGAIYRFQKSVDGFPDQQVSFIMMRSNPSTNQVGVMQSQEYIPGEILWDPNAAGGVMMDLTDQYETFGFPDYPFRGPLIWMPIGSEAPIALNVSGSELAWGD